MTRNSIRTRDGLRLPRLVRAATLLSGVTARAGTNHLYVLNYPGMRPCPVASSTSARNMIVPWLREITGENSQYIYQSLRRGRW